MPGLYVVLCHIVILDEFAAEIPQTGKETTEHAHKIWQTVNKLQKKKKHEKAEMASTPNSRISYSATVIFSIRRC